MCALALGRCAPRASCIHIRQSTLACDLTNICHLRLPMCGQAKAFSIRTSMYLYWDLLHWIVGLNFCTKTYTQHHNWNPLSKSTTHTINRMILIWVVGGQWIWDHTSSTYQNTSNTKYEHVNIHQRISRKN